MFKCAFCGSDNFSETARFCKECGRASKDWTPEDIDQPLNVTQYVSTLSEVYFDASEATLLNLSPRMRDRLKISHDTHAGVVAKLAAQKKAIEHLKQFRIEFNENVTDAYAKHDTFLTFRFTNLSEDDRFKVSLVWTDHETTGSTDFRAHTGSFVKPGAEVTLGGPLIFERMGIKELAGMQITVTDLFGNSANFKSASFSFKVGSHEQRISQNISTHNQISIEGRGVVDASRMGAERTTAGAGSGIQPNWKKLDISYVSQGQAQPAAELKASREPTLQQEAEMVETSKTPSGEFDRSDLLSVLTAAEKGNADAQNTLGGMYAEGIGVAKNDVQAAQWYRKAAVQGHGLGQRNLGFMYRNGRGLAENDEQALHWYRKSAEQGNPLGQRGLAWMYTYGKGVEQSYEQAVHWYREAAEQGDATAQNNLGLMYQEGEGVAQNDELAVRWYRAAAEQGDAAAQNNLGDMYAEGQGVAQHDELAVHWFRKAAEQGNAYAQFSLGLMCQAGQGVVPNAEQAMHWYRKAAEQGNATAQNNLGWMYRAAEGVALNDERAVHWFRKSAEQDFATAQNNLGDMYAEGKGVAQNDEQAVHWYRKAAEQSYAAAQNNLGDMFTHGEGVAQNDQQAVHWFRKAAEQGYATAQNSLGLMYQAGQGVVQNDEQAVHWFRKAAEQGDATAQNNLGDMYAEGEGVPQNDEQAVRWYRKAAEQGFTVAIEALRKFYTDKAEPQPPLSTHKATVTAPVTAVSVAKAGGERIFILGFLLGTVLLGGVFLFSGKTEAPAREIAPVQPVQPVQPAESTESTESVEPVESVESQVRVNTVSLIPAGFTISAPSESRTLLTSMLAAAMNPLRLAELKGELELLAKPASGDRKNARSLNDSGLQALKIGNYSGAADILRQAVAADEGDVEVRNNYVYALVKSNKVNEAEREAGMLLTQAPGRTSAWANLAEIYAAKGNVQPASMALIVAFQFSNNKDRTLAFLREKSSSPENSSLAEGATIALEILSNR